MSKQKMANISWDRENYNMGSITGHRIDYNWIGVLRKPAAHTQQKSTQVAPGIKCMLINMRQIL